MTSKISKLICLINFFVVVCCFMHTILVKSDIALHYLLFMILLIDYEKCHLPIKYVLIKMILNQFLGFYNYLVHHVEGIHF